MSEIKIACIGDVMCGDSFRYVGMGAAHSLDIYRSEFLPSDIVNFLRGHDIVLCNMESVISDIGRRENSLRSLHMRGRPQAARYLAEWGINIANVANNHILEQGIECAVDTVNQLHKAGIKTVGAGKGGLFQPGIDITEIDLKGRQIAVLGVCLRNEKYAFNGGGDLNETLLVIENCAKAGKLVIVSVHWGDELIDRPGILQREVGQQFIRAGAKLIIGHHPHVVQGIDNSGGNLIAYSLGNFIFDSFLDLTQWSIILSITISGGEIIQWDYLPVERDKEYRPGFVKGSRKAELMKEIERRCELLQLEMPQEQYDIQYKHDLSILESAARRKLWLELVKTMPHLKLVYWPQIFFRPIQRRLGIW